MLSQKKKIYLIFKFFKIMNICHIIESAGTGTLQMTINIANSQAKKKNNQVYVIYSKRKSTPKDINQKFSKKVKLIYVDMQNLLKFFIFLKKIVYILNKIKPDFLFLHSSFAGAIGRLASLFLKKRIPIFYIPHAISFLNYIDFNIIKRGLFILIENILNLKKAIYVAVTKSEMEGIKKRILFVKCEFIENSINIEKHFQKKISKKNLIIMVGEIRKKKGVESFCNIAKKVMVYEKNTKFVWIGDGNNELKKKLIDSNIKVKGWLDSRKVYKFYEDAAIYLTASKYEGMSISVLEALFFKSVVVAYACEGHKDLLVNNSTGFIFKNDYQATKIILMLLKNKKYLNKIANRAYLQNQKKFDLKNFNNSYDKLILKYHN